MTQTTPISRRQISTVIQVFLFEDEILGNHQIHNRGIEDIIARKIGKNNAKLFLEAIRLNTTPTKGDAKLFNLDIGEILGISEAKNFIKDIRTKTIRLNQHSINSLNKLKSTVGRQNAIKILERLNQLHI